MSPDCFITDGLLCFSSRGETDCVLFFLIGRGGSSGAKFRISLGLPVGAVINCADNTGIPQLDLFP